MNTLMKLVFLWEYCNIDLSIKSRCIIVKFDKVLTNLSLKVNLDYLNPLVTLAVHKKEHSR